MRTLALFIFLMGSSEGLAATACTPKLPADPRGVWIPAGEVTLGSKDFYPEERPQRTAKVQGFWIDATEVTNEDFTAFVRATGYKTVAERKPTAEANKGVPPEMLVPGSAVFTQPKGLVDLRDPRAWWRYVPGAQWRHPEGPASSLKGRERFPVVHVVYEDALAYAKWRGRALPTEAEWEHAARAGHRDRAYIWGDHPTLNGKPMANSYQGAFPLKDLGEDGHTGAAPVGCYPSNDWGLYDMAGNVWEWTQDLYPQQPGEFGIIKGGSYLCALSYCGRYRPAARIPGDRTMGTNHIGFRTVLRRAAR
ncbi:MAG TPA: hypothetical protein DCL54_13825 [Alphaproteobacteria bacterium]|nr:hypothetical protein [Alphaproteobacteria bacterium]